MIQIETHKKLLILVITYGLLSCTTESIRFELQSSHTKCIAEELKINSMTVGKYSVVNPNEDIPLPDFHKVTVRVTSSNGNSYHHGDKVPSGKFAFVTVEAGDYMACFWAPDHQPPITSTIDFEWKTGVAAKDWSSVAKKGQVDTSTHVCLITDFCPGGELFALLDKQPMKLFKEDSARFYAAEVVIGLEYLHCLGILLYEMLYGHTPFRGKNRQKTFANILYKDLTFPSSISSERDFAAAHAVSEAAKTRVVNGINDSLIYLLPVILKAVDTFLEELIVRGELVDNFCFYQHHYDSLQGAWEWARRTLMDRASDEREHIYTREQLEKAKTADPLWNASQLEMVYYGKMHGFMWMYWAKKILEWTRGLEEALEISIYLNDKMAGTQVDTLAACGQYAAFMISCIVLQQSAEGPAVILKNQKVSFQLWTNQRQETLNSKKRGDAAFRFKDFANALSYYTQFIDGGTMISPTVFARRCLCYLMSEMPQEALGYAMQAQVIAPEWPTAFYLQAAALFSLGMDYDAQESLKDGTSLGTQRHRN
ncbi:hypothetical protein SO802_011360 [Lithocarpus litseifolius]|uniref:GOLD domain-containing protein n=1 Tax=Lithocarpus litseifolius TaxID=425828 RepID=A0AAW2D141_9ROSI